MPLIQYFKKLFCYSNTNVIFTDEKRNIVTDEILVDEKTLIHSICALPTYKIWLMDDKEIDRDVSFDNLFRFSRCLPAQIDERPTLALDLDNTLIYASTKKLETYNHIITIKYNGREQNVWVVERPGLQKFLTEICEYYELILFTAGIRQYGIKMLMKIDPEMRIDYLLDRRFCDVVGKNQKQQDMYAKNLRILGRNLSKVLLVDDKLYSFGINTQNGILISYFTGDPNDRTLDRLKSYLITCAKLERFINVEINDVVEFN